jgi:protein gp37
MGCDGCELWNGQRKVCYAGRQTIERAGMKGWPVKFERPSLFLERVEPTLKWGPLTDMEKEAKPWIPEGYPRIIFLNDMGDTFSRLLPQNWMAPLLPRIAESPHQFLVLTKRPSLLRAFAEKHPLPPNFWPGTTFTTQPTEARIRELRHIKSGGPKFVSFEPLWSSVPPTAFDGIQWAIFGGESGRPEDKPAATPIENILTACVHAAAAGCRRFIKQLGSNPTKNDHRLQLKDFHGGEWAEWPAELQIREMPMLTIPQQATLL